MSGSGMAIESLRNGRYRVISVLGAGGFGITYQCEDTKHGVTCAIKEYMPEAIATRDPQTGEVIPSADRKRAFLHGKERFLEEAELLMRMNQIPCVVHVWEAFEENHTAYYVMEFLDGRTLKQVMRALGGKLPYTAALEAVVKAGTALDTVHRQAGIFHRDISPENIMVMPDGQVKIIDFGSAKAMAVSENQQFSVVLKPGFAPPEQYASNLSQGSFTDVYAMAGTFYYAVSGTMIPVAPDRLMGVKYERLDRLVPECSKEAADAVDRVLTLDAKFRTQTMSEFIQGILAGQSVVNLTQMPARTGTSDSQSAGETASGISESKSSSWEEPAQDGILAGFRMNDDAHRVPDPISRWQREVAGRDTEIRKTVERTAPPVQDELPTMALPRGPYGWLKVIKGACAGRIFPVEPNRTVTVGRTASKSEIVLNGHPEISGRHFRLLWQPQKKGFYVIDDSINGLYYRGIRLEKGKKYKVLPGDQLGVGSMECVITVGEEQHE
ncbi:MAG: FHA domain-containing serine/threonine-protein kinase [Clostridiales bacterium]|nr:FHA domain-containing serine/threonine-protein kinase [Clostridiales bacterium]